MKIGRPTKTLIRWVTRLHIFLFRMSKGRIGGTMLGVPVLLITTRGRKTGRLITMPLYYLEDQGVPYVVASFAGSDTDPAWWSNLKKNPIAHVELRGRSYDATARAVDDETRARLWPMFVAKYKSYESYQKATTRKIPIIALEPVTATSDTITLR